MDYFSAAVDPANVRSRNRMFQRRGFLASAKEVEEEKSVGLLLILICCEVHPTAYDDL